MPDKRAPEPSRVFFDPFNSSSTGHQTHASRLAGSTSWRDSRTKKLANQLADKSGRGGQKQLSDTVGAGSETFGKDGRKDNGSWEPGAPGQREKGWQSIAVMMNKNKNKKRKLEADVAKDEEAGVKRRKGFKEMSWPGPRKPPKSPKSISPTQDDEPQVVAGEPDTSPAAQISAPSTQLFRGLTLYINGSTFASGISDHYLKSLFVQNGGSLSLGLARRTVTHVILGTSKGLLAAGKIQKEISKVRGKGVRYVTAKWVIDSVEKGKRLPESRYSAVHVALSGQKAIADKVRP